MSSDPTSLLCKYNDFTLSLSNKQPLVLQTSCQQFEPGNRAPKTTEYFQQTISHRLTCCNSRFPGTSSLAAFTEQVRSTEIIKNAFNCTNQMKEANGWIATAVVCSPVLQCTQLLRCSRIYLFSQTQVYTHSHFPWSGCSPPRISL